MDGANTKTKLKEKIAGSKKIVCNSTACIVEYANFPHL